MADDTRTTGQSSELEDILDSIRRIMDEEEGYERMLEGRDEAEEVIASTPNEAVAAPKARYAFDEDMHDDEDMHNEAEDLGWIVSNHEEEEEDDLSSAAPLRDIAPESPTEAGESDYSDFADDNTFTDAANFDEEFLEQNAAQASSEAAARAAKTATPKAKAVIAVPDQTHEVSRDPAPEDTRSAPVSSQSDDMDVLDRVARSMFGSDDEGDDEGVEEDVLPVAPDLDAFGTDYSLDETSAEDYGDFGTADTAADEFEQFVQPAADLSGIESQFDSVADYAFDQGEAIEEEILELTDRLEGHDAEPQEPYLHHHFGSRQTDRDESSDPMEPAEPVHVADPAPSSVPVEETVHVQDTAHDETSEYAAKVLERAAGSEASQYSSARDDEALISEATERAAARAMTALTEDGGEGLRAIHSGIRISEGDDTMTVEALVRQMLRPMLKEWLNDNLPSIVDHQVRREVERVGSNARRYLAHDDEAG